MVEFLAGMILAAGLCIDKSDSFMEIGQEEQLFLDDHVIDRTENITRRVNQAQKHGEPVIRPDRSWEENRALIFGTALYDHDDSIFRMWYYCGGGNVAYAESSDGIDWQKPELDVVIQDGKKTNIVIERGNFGHFYEILGVLKDNIDSDSSRRYKAGFLSIQRDYHGEYEDPYHSGSRRGLGIAVSPDGIYWTMENEFASYEICDIGRFFWDSLIDRYVLYGRTKLTPENNDGSWRSWGWGRAVTRIESEDFRNWSKGELVLATDDRDPEGSEIYSMSAFPYEGIYIGMVQMFYGLPDQGNLEIQFATSRDGREFRRADPRDPFIPEGKVGDWDRFNISLGCMPPISVDDELWFYYGGRTYRHGPYNGKDSGPSSCHIGLAKIKRGRFVSLEASFDGGMVLTKPLILRGSQLFVNANAEFGSIQVALLDEQENQIPGWQSTISGEDSIRIPVSFERDSLADLAGRCIRIQFILKNAQIFGFCVQ
jgi:hypothetical protein